MSTITSISSSQIFQYLEANPQFQTNKATPPQTPIVQPAAVPATNDTDGDKDGSIGNTIDTFA